MCLFSFFSPVCPSPDIELSEPTSSSLLQGQYSPVPPLDGFSPPRFLPGPRPCPAVCSSRLQSVQSWWMAAGAQWVTGSRRNSKDPLTLCSHCPPPLKSWEGRGKEITLSSQSQEVCTETKGSESEAWGNRQRSLPTECSP